MPLLKRKLNLEHQYSRIDEGSADDTEIFLDGDFLKDLDPSWCDATDEEVVAGLDHVTWSNKVTDVPATLRSNKVTRRFRRLDKDDIQTLGKIRTTGKSAAPGLDPALVDDCFYPFPPLTDPWFNPLPSHLHHSNDNVGLPVWEHSGDRVKLVFANRGLVSLGYSPEGCWSDVAAFSLNLTPERIDEAQRHPKGFIDSLKRDLDRTFNRMIGEVPSCWFGAGATQDGRLHLHGAIHTKKSSAPTVKAALIAIGGKWPAARGDEYQLDLQPMTDADGWVRYVLKQGPAARRLIVTGKSLTIPKELRREGRRLYDAMRRPADMAAPRVAREEALGSPL